MKKILSLLFVLATTTTAIFANNFTLQASGASAPIPSKQVYSNGFSQGFCNFFATKNSFDAANEFAIMNTIQKTFDNLETRIVSTGVSHDPYIIKINGNKYMLIKENNDGKFDRNDILGINDTKETVFASLRPLDLNKDNRLTGEELSKSGVRLVKIDQKGKLINNKKQDFQNSRIAYIYMTELRKAYKNDGTTGDFGMYDVLIKNDNCKNSLVTGYVTFESANELAKYF